MVGFSTAMGPCALLALAASQCVAFVPLVPGSFAGSRSAADFGVKPAIVAPSSAVRPSSSALRMGLDLVTYLRTEFVSAALCTNQIPRSADVCLQLGTEDGRAVTFVPKTIRELITSSAESDGKLPVASRRQLKQQQERRKAATVRYVDQPSDDLREVDDESVDIVISLQAAQRMADNGQDWQRSVRESARVLKSGGRLLFVEQTEIGGISYLEYVGNLLSFKEEDQPSEADVPEEEGDEEDEEDGEAPVFECVGYDDVDLVIVPHVAGVFVKSEEAGMTPAERKAKAAADAKALTAERSISAFERGIKKRKKKKKKAKKGMESETSA